MPRLGWVGWSPPRGGVGWSPASPAYRTELPPLLRSDQWCFFNDEYAEPISVDKVLQEVAQDGYVLVFTR